MTAPKTETLFDDIGEFIAESRRLLHEGALVELAGLDAQVKRLCGQVEKLSVENRTQYADRMQQLFTDLTELEQAMISMRETLSKDIRALSDHQKANVAYRAAGTTKKNEE